ncbi:MAG: hypothetical protein NUV34_05165, partial [Sulfuricaulis sp.]|nr:hypothetical protein [Sulfuricaulis sp.]
MSDPAVVKVIVDQMSPPPGRLPGSPPRGQMITWRQAYEIRVGRALDAGLTGDEITKVAAESGKPTLEAIDSRVKEHKDWLAWTKQQSADAAATAKAFPARAAAASAQATAAKPPPTIASPTGAKAYIDNARANPDQFNVFMDSNGKLQVQDFVSGDENVFITDDNGNPVLYAKPDTGAGGESGAAASAAARLGEDIRQFDVTRGDIAARNTTLDAQREQDRRDTAARNAVGDQQWNTSYNEGIRQFGVTADRNSFESDRSFQQAADQFATNFAQTQANLEYQGASDKTRFGMEAERFAGEQATADRAASLAEQ